MLNSFDHLVPFSIDYIDSSFDVISWSEVSVIDLHFCHNLDRYRVLLLLFISPLMSVDAGKIRFWRNDTFLGTGYEGKDFDEDELRVFVFLAN